MAKTKGCAKTGGRKKGTPNKTTGSVREWIAGVIDSNREQMESDLQELEPKERLAMLEKLMQYVVPKQQAVSANVNFDQMTDDQLDMLINEMTSGL